MPRRLRAHALAPFESPRGREPRSLRRAGYDETRPLPSVDLS
jgi:hypothetical protein